ncbi:hypothetical protein J3Q64DRAFT_1827075 [Phycomyces blakesleeanus]|uniref:Uncharacterized protein n=2 Tax=Phycomyces blakesleeanus TaxID=4837 RepID=A0A167PHR4_PHYB8|nr:hypothetical protein PHYBLDRAFT_79190 [Phycomyces blakesleeanus NRRL 1555(-)]OAD77938.1 hypothetical protein PHYBLDRAFT_79190 [Phycomyces blakesleeanus NRRL 1555(-)]|eukprot:XP_018295978.1 hypothetical protein PHYBLDRAFT_79190 [Phycomyces blakesleeanus NRRL 1555(-)]
MNTKIFIAFLAALCLFALVSAQSSSDDVQVQAADASGFSGTPTSAVAQSTGAVDAILSSLQDKASALAGSASAAVSSAPSSASSAASAQTSPAASSGSSLVSDLFNGSIFQSATFATLFVASFMLVLA